MSWPVKDIPKRLILLSSILLVLLFGLLDYLSGPEISLSIFYLAPIYLATWHWGRKAGLFITVLSIVTWAFADFYIERVFAGSFTMYWNLSVRLGFFIITTNLIADLCSRLEFEEQMARTDPLTGLSNRRLFYEVAETEVARARRNRTPFTVIYIDLDNFKAVNDDYGHDTGDQLLTAVGAEMGKNIRSTDFAARLGGDEFAILLPDADEDSAKRFIQKLHNVLLECVREQHWPVTFSIGAVTYLQPPASVDVIMKETDQHLYYVKQHGKNKIHHKVQVEDKNQSS